MRPEPLRPRYPLEKLREAVDLVVVLNQKVRPFTAKWHPHILASEFDKRGKTQFRAELRDLQTDLRNYTCLLADLADVEDLTDLQDV